MRGMRQSAVIVLLITIWSSLCVAQQKSGPTNNDFVLELTISSADKRTELLAPHPELLTVDLRKELVEHGNQRFARTQYAQALEIYKLVEKISEQISDKEGVATAWLNIGSVNYFQANYD